ncbi:MAG: RpiB/LacA/LacB family sugar-phosphate isomerase [Mucinivorans sp.]
MITIGLAADHGGYEMKEFVAGYLMSLGYGVKDYGCHSAASVDYPDFAHALARGIEEGQVERAFAFCGSANGISMSLNRHAGIRAAVCWKPQLATLARAHNDANVCSIPGRFVSQAEAAAIVDAYLAAAFEGGRHTARVEKIESR